MIELPTILEQPTAQQHESAKAQWWRVNVVKLTVRELADLTGYSVPAIYFMERGISADGSAVRKWVFQRYKMACAGVHAALIGGLPFNWEDTA